MNLMLIENVCMPVTFDKSTYTQFHMYTDFIENICINIFFYIKKISQQYKIYIQRMQISLNLKLIGIFVNVR